MIRRDRDGAPASSARGGWFALTIALTMVGTARADTPRNTPAAIEVDRDLAPAGRVGFGFDGGEPVDAWGVSVAAGWIERPIRLASGTFGAGTPATQPVRRRETLSLGGALAVGDSVVIDLAVRASHQVGDRLAAAGDPERLARYVFHDVRFGGRIRVVGNRDRAALLRAELTLPSGNAEQLAGDARWTAAWSLIGRATLPRDIVIAATAGVRLHGAEVTVGDRLVGDALFAAAGVAVPVPQLGPLRDLAEPVKLTGELLGFLGDHVGKLSGTGPARGAARGARAAAAGSDRWRARRARARRSDRRAAVSRAGRAGVDAARGRSIHPGGTGRGRSVRRRPE